MNRLVTPEAVELDLPVATVATRALGRLLDVALQVLALVLVLVGASVSGAADEDVLGIVITLVAVFLVRIVYPIAFETRFGATIGQRAMGLRIVTDDGAPIRLRQAFVRAAVGLFEIEATGGLLAFVVAASRADGKRLGDIAAGTVAVSVRVGTARAAVLGITCPPQLEGWAGQLDTSGLTSAHRGALRRFHERATTLGAARRQELASGLVARLLPVLGATRPLDADDVDVLRAIEWAANRRARAAAPRPSGVGPRPDGAPPPPPPPGAGAATGRTARPARPEPDTRVAGGAADTGGPAFRDGAQEGDGAGGAGFVPPS